MRSAIFPWSALCLALLPVGAMMACRQIVGVEDREQAQAAGGSAGASGSSGSAGSAGAAGSPPELCQSVPVPAGVCGQCTREKCCDEALQCQNDAWCWHVHSCLASCSATDPTCRSGCMADTPEYGVATVLSACQASKCEEQCETSCGGWVYRVDGCASCAEAKCCAKELACASEAGCRALEKCIQLCAPADWACFWDCNLSDPAASALDGAAYGCMFGQCAGACGMGSVWSCIDKPHTPQTDHTSFEYTTYSATLAGEPLEGVSVRACTGMVGNCSKVVGEGITGKDGLAAITVEIGKAGSFWGWFELSAPDRIPVLAQYVPRLTGAPTVNTMLLLSPAEVSELDALVDGDIDMSQGAAMVFLLDCGSAPARDVTIDPPTADASVLYSDQGNPSKGMTATDEAGVVFLFNIKPGLQTITVRKPSGELLMQGVLEIRAGTLTVATIAPH